MLIKPYIDRFCSDFGSMSPAPGASRGQACFISSSILGAGLDSGLSCTARVTLTARRDDLKSRGDGVAVVAHLSAA